MQGRKTFDKDKVQVNLARIRKSGQSFEVVVDADKAVELREGADLDIREVLKSTEIFADAKKGLLAPESQFEEIFGTKDKSAIARSIIDDGEIQLTSEYRHQLREAKIKRVLTIIHRNGVDPGTHLPHPMTRLENAFDEAKVRVDEFKKAEDQVQTVLKALRVVLPIKFEVAQIALKIPADHAPRAYGTIKNHAKIIKEEWQSDGSWVAVVEIPAGLRDEFFDSLNGVTHGNVESKIVKTK